jgi:hypothetical protein
MSEQTKHTPGPWHFSDDLGQQHGCRLIHAKDGRLVADAGRIHYRTDAEMDANARLIATAPDLLEALETMVRWTEMHGLNTAELITGGRAEVPVVGMARAAISKAREGL